jgi:hypothetical protein
MSNVFVIAPVVKSTTNRFPDSELARSQRPSLVMTEEKAILGREIDRTTALVVVSMTTMRGVSWSCVKTNLPSGEIEMRCTRLEIGIVASKVRFCKSRTLRCLPRYSPCRSFGRQGRSRTCACGWRQLEFHRRESGSLCPRCKWHWRVGLSPVAPARFWCIRTFRLRVLIPSGQNPHQDDAVSTKAQRPSRGGMLSRLPSLATRMTDPLSRRPATA